MRLYPLALSMLIPLALAACGSSITGPAQSLAQAGVDASDATIEQVRVAQSAVRDTQSYAEIIEALVTDEQSDDEGVDAAVARLTVALQARERMYRSLRGVYVDFQRLADADASDGIAVSIQELAGSYGTLRQVGADQLQLSLPALSDDAISIVEEALALFARSRQAKAVANANFVILEVLPGIIEFVKEEKFIVVSLIQTSLGLRESARNAVIEAGLGSLSPTINRVVDQVGLQAAPNALQTVEENETLREGLKALLERSEQNAVPNLEAQYDQLVQQLQALEQAHINLQREEGSLNLMTLLDETEDLRTAIAAFQSSYTSDSVSQ